MDRIIPLSKIRAAVDAAYEALKSEKYGEVDPRLTDVDANKFGISIVLTDGTIINKADTDVASPLGHIVRIPMATMLLQQMTPPELIKKAGKCPAEPSAPKPEGVHGAHGTRAMSAIEPVGDPDSKWNFLEGRMIDMMGSAPLLDDKLYEARKAKITEDGLVDKFAAAGYYLYDDTYQSIDLYLRAKSMTATAEQAAIMAATVAADGVNPITKKIVYDGAISQTVVGMMASHGPRKMSFAWAVGAGIPAYSSFGGLVVGVFPGRFGIAAYSPELFPNRVSAKAAKAIISIMRELQISPYASANIVIDKDK